MTRRALLTIVGVALAALTGCVSGVKPPETYVGQNGKVTVIESDREMCERSCNDTYDRCMESGAAVDNSGVNGPTGYVGATGECRDDLKNCLPTCKGQ